MKEWEYTKSKFSGLPENKKWLLRYQVSYVMQLIIHKSVRRIIYNLLLYSYLLTRQFWFIFEGSLFRRSYFLQGGETIFFVSPDISYLQHLLPIIKKYFQQKKSTLILCYTADYKKILSFLDLNFPASKEKLRCIETIGNKDSAILLKWLAFPFLFIADAAEYASIKPRKFLLTIPDFAKFSLVRRFYEKRIEGWINKMEMLITANDNWMWESVLHEKAKANNIPNFIIQHGLIGAVSFQHIGSHICVWGEYYKKRMIGELGVDEKEVIVTGSGYFDNLYNDYSKTAAEKKYITFMTQPYAKTPLILGKGIYEQTVQWLNMLIPLARKHNLQLLVKLHPRDKTEFYAQLKNHSFTKSPLLEILSQTKLAITIDSTSIIEASLLNLPVIQLHNPSFPRFFDLSESGLSIVVRSEEQLFATVERLLNDKTAFREAVEKTREGQKQHFYRLGNSLEYFDENIHYRQEAGSQA